MVEQSRSFRFPAVVLIHLYYEPCGINHYVIKCSGPTKLGMPIECI